MTVVEAPEVYADGRPAGPDTALWTTILRGLATLALVLACGFLHAEEVREGSVLQIATREGVTVPVYVVWRDDAVLSVVLFSGGGGGYGRIGADGWPESGNFLIRTGKHWARYPFNLIMVGRPSDGLDLSLGQVRTGAEHLADTQAILRVVKARSDLPVWLVGTSMGTISVAAAAIEDTEQLVSGLVLTSSIVGSKIPGNVPRQPLERIRVPTLIVHHEADACRQCRPDEVSNIANGLRNAPLRKTLMLSGGTGATGNPCNAMHYHGYIGMENETVDRIAAWMSKPVAD